MTRKRSPPVDGESLHLVSCTRMSSKEDKRKYREDMLSNKERWVMVEGEER